MTVGQGDSASLAVNASGQSAASWVGRFVSEPISSEGSIMVQRVYVQMFRADGSSLWLKCNRWIWAASIKAPMWPSTVQGNVVVAWNHTGLDGRTVLARDSMSPALLWAT